MSETSCVRRTTQTHRSIPFPIFTTAHAQVRVRVHIHAHTLAHVCIHRHRHTHASAHTQNVTHAPDSQVILTTRELDSWLRSYRKYVDGSDLYHTWRLWPRLAMSRVSHRDQNERLSAPSVRHLIFNVLIHAKPRYYFHCNVNVRNPCVVSPMQSEPCLTGAQKL